MGLGVPILNTKWQSGRQTGWQRHVMLLPREHRVPQPCCLCGPDLSQGLLGFGLGVGLFVFNRAQSWLICFYIGNKWKGCIKCGRSQNRHLEVFVPVSWAVMCWTLWRHNSVYSFLCLCWLVLGWELSEWFIKPLWELQVTIKYIFLRVFGEMMSSVQVNYSSAPSGQKVSVRPKSGLCSLPCGYTTELSWYARPAHPYEAETSQWWPWRRTCLWAPGAELRGWACRWKDAAENSERGGLTRMWRGEREEIWWNWKCEWNQSPCGGMWIFA